MDEETKRLKRKIILENKRLGGSSWKDLTKEELDELDLGYLAEEQS